MFTVPLADSAEIPPETTWLSPAVATHHPGLCIPGHREQELAVWSHASTDNQLPVECSSHRVLASVNMECTHAVDPVDSDITTIVHFLK